MHHRLVALPVLLTLIATQAEARQPTDPNLERARALLRSSPIIDGHNDLAWAIRRAEEHPMDVRAYDLHQRTPFHTDLPRLKQGGVGGQFWSVYVPGEVADSGFARLQLEQIDIARQFIALYPELELALTADDVERIMREGRVASMLGMEGGHVIENSLGALRAYYDLGARYLTLTHNVTLDWADAAAGPARHDGLTEFGREVVREMNRLGMLVDLSHVSPATMSDALDVAEAPVIFSHSSARAVTDVGRNVPDDILRRLPANGGVVMVTFVPSFISEELAAWGRDSIPRLVQELDRRVGHLPDTPERQRTIDAFWAEHPAPKATVGQLADHIEHVRDVAGIDHVGIGGDYDGIDDTPLGMADVSTYPVLFAELIRRGWSDADLRKLAQGNVLRALRQAEQVARRLQAERPPSTMVCCLD